MGPPPFVIAAKARFAMLIAFAEKVESKFDECDAAKDGKLNREELKKLLTLVDYSGSGEGAEPSESEIDFLMKVELYFDAPATPEANKANTNTNANASANADSKSARTHQWLNETDAAALEANDIANANAVASANSSIDKGLLEAVVASFCTYSFRKEEIEAAIAKHELNTLTDEGLLTVTDEQLIALLQDLGNCNGASADATATISALLQDLENCNGASADATATVSPITLTGSSSGSDSTVSVSGGSTSTVSTVSLSRGTVSVTTSTTTVRRSAPAAPVEADIIDKVSNEDVTKVRKIALGLDLGHGGGGGGDNSTQTPTDQIVDMGMDPQVFRWALNHWVSEFDAQVISSWDEYVAAQNKNKGMPCCTIL